MAEWSRASSRINRSRQSSTAALASWIFSRKALLGKSAPAPDNVATARHVQSMCHKPAREEKNGRGRNENESI